jgi:protoporphyrinogen oxidase
MQTIIILGAGPAGLALAVKLLRRPELNIEVVVIEQKPYVGGISASFEHEGLIFDYGSHRLHPSTAQEIMQDLRYLLGSDLLERPRNGRIRLLGNFVHFPLNPLDLFLHLPPSFILGFGWDIVTKLFRRRGKSHSSFADALLEGLGYTICNAFYFPYARKLWGLDPEEISAVQAYRRISANNVVKIMRKAFAVIPGFRSKKSGIFFYPSKGFGQICEVMAQEVERLGGKVNLFTDVREIHVQNGRAVSIVVAPSDAALKDDKSQIRSGSRRLHADFVFSTIPMNVLMNCLRPEPPTEVSNRCRQLQYRSMVFCYLVLETDQFSPYDAHYFPESNFIFSRLSEPKNYSAAREPFGVNKCILCII